MRNIWRRRYTTKHGSQGRIIVYSSAELSAAAFACRSAVDISETGRVVPTYPNTSCERYATTGEMKAEARLSRPVHNDRQIKCWHSRNDAIRSQANIMAT